MPAYLIPSSCRLHADFMPTWQDLAPYTIKQWMAQVASDRLDQMQDPELNSEKAPDYLPPADRLQLPDDETDDKD